MGFGRRGESCSTLRLLCVCSFMNYNLQTLASCHKNSLGYLYLISQTIEVINQIDSHIYFVYDYFIQVNSNTSTSSFPSINSFFFGYFFMRETSQIVSAILNSWVCFDCHQHLSLIGKILMLFFFVPGILSLFLLPLNLPHNQTLNIYLLFYLSSCAQQSKLNNNYMQTIKFLAEKEIPICKSFSLQRKIVSLVIQRLEPRSNVAIQKFKPLKSPMFILFIKQIRILYLIIKPMQQNRQELQEAYILPQRVSCNKHPSKLIDYFCKHPQCTDRLFCSSCLLKKQYCRHEMNPYIIDIAEFMYEQKMSFEMKGLSKQADIHDYLINKQSRRKMYDDVVDAQIKKFQQELNDMTKSIMKTIQDLRASIIGQLQQFKGSYAQTQQMMMKKVQQAFKNSYMAQFQTFDEVVSSKDCSTLIGLRQLLEKLTLDNTDGSKIKQIQKFYENLISMHDQTPEIDYTRFQSIKSYFNVFQNKLSQAGPLLITLHKASNIVPTTKDLNPNAMLDNLSTVPVSGVKKYAKSASFPSNHSRTVYVALKLPERKIITGSDDGSLNMFDMTTFENIGSYQCHVGGVRCMISLPNSKLVTGSYDKTIKIWPDPLKLADLSQSNLQLSQISQLSKKTNAVPPLSPLKTLTGHTSSVISLKYLNDGITFASGSADYNIKIWDFEKGENIKNFSGHMSDILCIECTSNGNTLISGSADRTIKVWSLTKKYSSACLKTLTGHTDFIWTILLLQDDSTLFSGGLDKTIKMWDINTGNLIRNLPLEHSSHITKLLQLSKEVVVSCGNDGNIKFWDYRSNSCTHTLQLQVGISTMLVTNEQGIVAVGQDKNIFLCD